MATITKDLYDKLPPLERIEYLVRQSRIERKFVRPDFQEPIYLTFFLSMFVINISIFIGLMTGSKYSALSIFNIIPKIVILGIFMMLLYVFINLVLSLYQSKSEKKLEEEFFTTSVKRKSK